MIKKMKTLKNGWEIGLKVLPKSKTDANVNAALKFFADHFITYGGKSILIQLLTEIQKDEKTAPMIQWNLDKLNEYNVELSYSTEALSPLAALMQRQVKDYIGVKYKDYKRVRSGLFGILENPKKVSELCYECELIEKSVFGGYDREKLESMLSPKALANFNRMKGELKELRVKLCV